MSPIVGFCIPTFNRKNMVYELITNLLSINNDNFEIVVLDNCSSDGTLELLDSLDDPRLLTYAQTEPVAPLQNMFDCLCLTSAKWIFQVNDRDMVNINYYDLLIDSLTYLETQNVGFAVAGEHLSEDSPFSIFSSGKEVINEFAIRDSHTTGQIIRKDCWDCIPEKQDFFTDLEQYGTYPHGYIYAILGQQYNGAYLHFDITDQAHYNERLSTVNASSFYGASSSKKEWFYPQSRYELLIYSINHLHIISDTNLYEDYILTRYSRTFVQATYGYFSVCQNANIKRRYNVHDLKCSRTEVLRIACEFITKFYEYLQTTTQEWCSPYFINKIGELSSNLIKNLLSWVNEPLIQKKKNEILSAANGPLVSIVMPVFNRPAFLEKALASIYAQTYTNYEIICVNDGSTDNGIIDILETNQKVRGRNFSYYSTEKKGAGHARNLGLQFAKGKYTMFLDSDDIFDASMLEKLVISAEFSAAEITFCNFISFEESNGKYNICSKIHGTKCESIYDRQNESWIQNMIKNPWSKMFLTDFLKTNKIRFQEISSANDVAFSVISNILATKFAFVDQDPLIYYRVSNSQISNTRKSVNAISVIQYIQNDLEQRNIITTTLQHQIDVFGIFFILDEIRFCRDTNANSETIKYLLEKLENTPIDFENANLKKYLDNAINQLTGTTNK